MCCCFGILHNTKELWRRVGFEPTQEAPVKVKGLQQKEEQLGGGGKRSSGMYLIREWCRLEVPDWKVFK